MHIQSHHQHNQLHKRWMFKVLSASFQNNFPLMLMIIMDLHSDSKKVVENHADSYYIMSLHTNFELSQVWKLREHIICILTYITGLSPYKFMHCNCINKQNEVVPSSSNPFHSFHISTLPFKEYIILSCYDENQSKRNQFWLRVPLSFSDYLSRWK